MTGTIVRGVGGFYYVREDETAQVYALRAKGIFRKRKQTPLVGDRVEFTPGEGEALGWVDELLPRTSESLRPPVANVDLLLLVIAPHPQPDLLLVDRLLIRAIQGRMNSILLVNKSDLGGTLYDEVCEQYKGTQLQVFNVSAQTGDGLDEVRDLMRGKISCFAGQSAVGKSSLINILLGLDLETGGLSHKTDRGRHTTRHAELLYVDEFRLMDTPGFSLLTLEEGMEPEVLREYYPEYDELSPECRFQPCLHDREPGCAVRMAVQRGELSTQRHERYRELLSQVQKTWRERFD